MNYLAINTTNENLNVVLRIGERVFLRDIAVGQSGHSSQLMPCVDALLRSAGVDAKDIDYYAVVVGPGSFTGIRIGVAAMTAMAFATGAKRVAINSFELLAYNRGSVTAAIDAGHSNTYLAECKDGQVLSTRFVASDEERVPGNVVTKCACPTSEAMDAIVARKIERGETVNVFEPFYMRKSQAERNFE